MKKEGKKLEMEKREGLKFDEEGNIVVFEGDKYSHILKGCRILPKGLVVNEGGSYEFNGMDYFLSLSQKNNQTKKSWRVWNFTLPLELREYKEVLLKNNEGLKLISKIRENLIQLEQNGFLPLKFEETNITSKKQIINGLEELSCEVTEAYKWCD